MYDSLEDYINVLYEYGNTKNYVICKYKSYSMKK